MERPLSIVEQIEALEALKSECQHEKDDVVRAAAESFFGARINKLKRRGGHKNDHIQTAPR